ncbi:hypothetical protein Hanom_Chr13g01188821 [Helianthus anomalus]
MVFIIKHAHETKQTRDEHRTYRYRKYRYRNGKSGYKYRYRIYRFGTGTEKLRKWVPVPNIPGTVRYRYPVPNVHPYSIAFDVFVKQTHKMQSKCFSQLIQSNPNNAISSPFSKISKP